MLSYREDDPAAIVGSYSFRSQRYPADVDTINTVETLRKDGEWRAASTADKMELAREFVRRLQKIVENTLNATSTFYLEVKAGYDWGTLDEFYPIGDMRDGVFTPDSDLRGKIMLAKGKGEIAPEDAGKILSILGGGSGRLGAEAYDLITNSLRKAYVMRWRPLEIMAGKKLHGVGKGTPLARAVYDPDHPPTLVKIDVIAKMRGSFLELSNIYILRAAREDGSYEYLTSGPDIENLTLDVEKMLFSPMWYNPFKAIKRMFVYARARFTSGDEGYAPFLEEALAFLNSDNAIFYQIKSELETVVKLLREFPKALDRPQDDKPPPYFAVSSQLDGMKSRLAATGLPDSDIERLSRTIDSAIHAPHSEAAELLEGVETALKGIVKEAAIKWLNTQGYGPPSARLDAFLPTEAFVARLNATTGPADPLLEAQHRRTYDWSLVGTPVAAAGYNVAKGGCALCASSDECARGKLRRLILQQQ